VDLVAAAGGRPRTMTVAAKMVITPAGEMKGNFIIEPNSSVQFHPGHRM